jgi:putative aldouronate transport system permease protein
VFPFINAAGMLLLMFVTLYPVLNTVAISFNDGTDAIRGGIGLLPRVFSIKSYETIFADEIIFNAFFITIARTAIQVVLNIVLTSMLAFALSRREYVLRKFITTAMVITMYVNAGLIPNYLLIQRTLGLGKSFWVYIIPTMFSCFNMIVMRTYILGLPEELVESGRIDGAGDFYLFWRIIFPLMLPVAATIALFVAVGAWNSWYLLKMKLATTTNSANAAMTTSDAASSTTLTTPITIRAAITVVSAAPIMAIYPFLQRYFVTGLSVGSIKG